MRNQDMRLPQKRTADDHVDSLRTTVLSAFTCITHHPDSSNNVAKRRKQDRHNPTLLKPDSVNNLTDDLCCISTDTGASHLLRLKQALQRRSFTSAQLASYLFTCDEVDTGPPLCSAVHLLQTRLIHLSDIRPSSMIERVILEMKNPDTCSCRGQRNGVQAVIRFVLQDNCSAKRDTFVQHFLAILFQNRQADSPIPQKQERFRLAEHLLSALQEMQIQEGEDMSKVHEWVRQASLPTRAVHEKRSELNSHIWTAELSGLATGRSPWEYLAYGKAEERALITLFKLLPPLNASRVYLECIHSVIRQTTESSGLPPRAIGSWSRVVILGRRVLDTTCFADADPELKRGIQGSLNGVLAASISLNKYHDVAVILCLMRCVLVLGRNTEEWSSSSKDLKEYKVWLRDFVGRNHCTTLEALFKTLTELIPLEPLKLLRINHRVLSLRREHASLASEYLVSVRARISDLDPARSKRFFNPEHKDFANAGSEWGNESRREEEVIQYIVDYAKLRKIPPSLVRKMNFHRHYFRTQILKSLFDASLGDKFREKPFNGQAMNVDSFDDCRIDIIKELAFNRKDKAVTAAEANEAIASILATRHQTKTVQGPECPSENVTTSVAAASSAVQKICRAVFEECQLKSNSPDITCITAGTVLTNVGVLVKKIEELWKSIESPIRGPEIAAELLHGMTNALEETGLASYPEIFRNMLDNDCNSVLRIYGVWWNSHGMGLLQAIRHLLETPTGGKIQKFLQYQLFALLCAGEACLTTKSVISLAMFATGLAKAGGAVALMDTLMLSKSCEHGSCEDFLSNVVSCLPLTRADTVTISVTFAIHCVCLHVALIDIGSPSCLEKKAVKNGSANLGNHKVSFAASRAYRSLLDLLRWVISHPWRLSAFPVREFLPSRVKVSGYAVSAITFITRLLVSHKVPVPHHFTVEQYVHIEERCGWGQVGSVYGELRKRELAGIHPTRLLCQFALFLAKRNSSRWPSVAWMEQGMLRYAEETISCGALETSNHMNLCDAPRFLKRSVNSTGTGVGYRLLNLYSRMRFCYFHGYSGADLEQHLAGTLVPWYWPFSPPVTDYLWDCLNKRCSSWESDQCSIKDNFLLVSNFAMNGLVRKDYVRDISGQAGKYFTAGTRSNDLVSKRTELWKAMEELWTSDCGMDNHLGTQVITRSVSRSLLSANLTKAFGSCVVLGLAKKCQLLERSARVERVRAWIHQVGTIVDDGSLCDFLGASVSVASLLPFTRLVEEYDRHDEVTEITDDILTEFLKYHVQLLGEGTYPFQWTRALLSSSLVCDDDLRTNIVMWLGWHIGNDEGTSKRNMACFPVDICMGRVFQSVGSLCDESLGCIVSNIGHDCLSKCLIPNILNTCRRLSSYDCKSGDIKLSKLSYDMLLERKEKLTKEMITGVIRLLTSARKMLAGFGDGAVDEVVSKYPEFYEEVVSRVTASVCNKTN